MKKKDWFILIILQILIAVGVFLCFVWISPNRISCRIDTVDAITIWAGVITIVFLVFSVMGLMNIDRKIDDVDSVKEKQEEKFQEIESRTSKILSSADAVKKEIVSKSEEQIKKIVNNSTVRVNFFDRLISILRDPMIDRQIMGFGDLLRETRNVEGIDLAYIYINRGHAYMALRKYKEAFADFEQAIDVCHNENKSSAFASMASYFVQTGDFSMSVEYFKKALELNPQSAPLCMDLGNSLMKLGKTDEADTYFLRALSYNPEMAEVYYNKSIRYSRSSDMADREQCMAYLNKCIDINPNFILAYINKAALLREQNNNADARKLLDDVVSRIINKDFLMAVLQRGISSRLLGDYPMALNDFLFVLIYEPNNIQNLSNLAQVYMLTLDFKKARFYAEKGMNEANLQNYHDCDEELQGIYIGSSEIMGYSITEINLDDITSDANDEKQS